MKIKMLLPALFAGAAVFAQTSVSGFVFEDLNKNGIKDRNEKGIAHVAVSNNTDVVLTDSAGRYSLPVKEDQIYFVIKPPGYQTRLNSQHLPQFYYNHKPAGSPQGYKYPGVAATKPLPRSLDFPLYPQAEKPEFQILVFGDPQPYTLKELDYFRKGIVGEVKQNRRNAVFGITLGDLVGDDLSLQPAYAEAVKEISLPWYNVMGNHDMNYEAKEDRLSDETFEKNFGPNNYSFNYANVHFIVLDDIIYPDPRDGKGYQGGFREDQLKFVENDLKYVPKDKLVVLAFHIQLMPEGEADHFRDADRQRLFDLLQPYDNVFMMSAHTHTQSQLFYSKGHGWNGAKNLHEFNAGTTSGDWYSGTIDAAGVPASVMRDGTYRGYSFINFKNNTYDIEYKVAGKPQDFQINLFVPKVIANRRNTARAVANVFVGSEKDAVEYRIDGGKWKPMEYTPTFDPEYTATVLQWDQSETLLPGRRPSNPETSKHLWSVQLPNKLENGNHRIEVRATDLFGKVHTAQKEFRVSDPVEIK